MDDRWAMQSALQLSDSGWAVKKSATPLETLSDSTFLGTGRLQQDRCIDLRRSAYRKRPRCPRYRQVTMSGPVSECRSGSLSGEPLGSQ